MTERERRDFERLSAYCDGELRGLACWRLERRLRREPRLRRELELLQRIGEAARAGVAKAPRADLWDRIAMRLPAADAARSEARSAGGRGLRPAWLVGGPLGVAAATLAAFAVVSWLGETREPAGGVVRWVYAGKRNVFVLEDRGAPGTTIIWVLDGGARQTARRPSGGMAS